VSWSYDHLEDAEKALLERCSVFAGGFDLESACVVGGFDDDYVVLDLLDALVRKSLLAVDRTSGRTRFSMLETIRQFAEEQLAAHGQSADVRTTHARYFADREPDVLSLWDSLRQREAYDWFTRELANLRTAFRWAADQGDLDLAAPIATSAAFLGFRVETYEPIAWAEELIEPARAADFPRLALLYAMAAQCWMPGRMEAAVGYSEAGQIVFSEDCEVLPYEVESLLVSVYQAIGQPERAVEWWRAQLAHGLNPQIFTRGALVLALTVAGSFEEAMAVATGLVDAAEATHNPCALSFALFAYGYAVCDADPGAALAAVRRGLVVAQESGNRGIESFQVDGLARLEAKYGEPLAALDDLSLAIRNYHDSGNVILVHSPLAVLAALFHRLGHHEAAATIAGFAFNPLTAGWFPEITTAIAHLRDVLGVQAYESLARKGEAMTTAAMVTYAYDQIDQARAELNAVSK
jgi:tetratricopeptide (TPR) repeat protein